MNQQFTDMGVMPARISEPARARSTAPRPSSRLRALPLLAGVSRRQGDCGGSRPASRLSALLLFLASVLVLATGCDAMFGSKADLTTDEIFKEGRIDPRLLDEVGYVPLTPFFRQGALGALEAPVDVYIGYDTFIYVADGNGLHVLDLAGRPSAFLPLSDATSVTQDRRLHVYVTALRDTLLNGTSWRLPVVYRFSGISTGTPKTEDIIWHPFDDDSRRFSRPDPVETDLAVRFTAVAVLHDNRVYISRRGPLNPLRSPILPHNAVMEFSPSGVNTRTIALNPVSPSLRSAINPSDVTSYIHPPQRQTYRRNDDFLLAQLPSEGERLRYAILAIRSVETPDGIVFQPNSDLLRPVGDPDRGDGFLFDEFKFRGPSDIAFAADGTNYILVLDGAADSLYVFTSAGVEGVAPAPGSGRTKPVVVSFGGKGDSPLQFNTPSGIATFNRIVYVADTGNNRISRFKLNTDFE